MLIEFGRKDTTNSLNNSVLPVIFCIIFVDCQERSLESLWFLMSVHFEFACCLVKKEL